MRFRLLYRLHMDDWLVVVAADGPCRAHDHTAAFGLRLERQGVRERAPARLEPGHATLVAADRDAVLIHLHPARLIHHRPHLDRRATAMKPGGRCDAMAQIVQQRAASGLLLIPPGLRLVPRG